jgi:hypothetical protein
MYGRPPMDSSPLFTGSAAEYRAAVQRADAERALVRRRALDSQTAVDTGPRERIRLWERLHALQLPTGAAHPLLTVIATETKLTLLELREEQQRRRTLDQSARHSEGA